jgi:hypothetical protein
MTPLASALPENSNDGYVAAAYIVFFLIVLVYVTIMAIRLTRVERNLRNLQARAGQSPDAEQSPDEGPRARGVAPDETHGQGPDGRAPDGQGHDDQTSDGQTSDGQTLERETV